MAEVNEIVRYGAQGICRIQQIEEKSIGASRRLYYVLKPVYYEDSTIFVPVDNPALTGKMHRLLRAQEVLELLSGLAGDDGLWVEDEAQRREAYEQILRSGDRVGMARLIRALSLQKVRLGAQRKKLHAAEEAILKEAERELNEEFAYVLGLSLEETPAFIRNLIETDEESEEETRDEKNPVRLLKPDDPVFLQGKRAPGMGRPLGPGGIRGLSPPARREKDPLPHRGGDRAGGWLHPPKNQAPEQPVRRGNLSG